LAAAFAHIHFFGFVRQEYFYKAFARSFFGFVFADDTEIFSAINEAIY
jgi:hypothetical protein